MSICARGAQDQESLCRNTAEEGQQRALSILRKWKGQASATMLKPVASNANRKAVSWACGGLLLAVPKAPMVYVIFGPGHVMGKCLLD